MLKHRVVTVAAKEPYLRWLQSVPVEDTTTLDDVNSDASAYLLSDHRDDDERQRLLTRYYDRIVESKLIGWWTEKEDWPKKRDLLLFTRWFDVEFHSVVVDRVEDELGDGK